MNRKELRDLLSEIRSEGETQINESRWKPAFVPPQYKQLMAQVGAFHAMVKSHQSDLKKATGFMKRLEDAMKSPAFTSQGENVPEAVGIMGAVNASLNNCHMDLGAVVDKLHETVAVSLPDWKRGR